jgi:hypothetical protein
MHALAILTPIGEKENSQDAESDCLGLWQRVMIALLLLLGSSPTLAESRSIVRRVREPKPVGDAALGIFKVAQLVLRRRIRESLYTSAVASTPPAASELHRAQEGARDTSLHDPVSAIQPSAEVAIFRLANRDPESRAPRSATMVRCADPSTGRGDPLLSGRDAESLGAAVTEDARSLLMEVLGVPEDAPVKIRGWIENSFTGNANGRWNGINFGVNPNYKADQWMGNQYYLIVERPLEQEDKVNFGFRMDNMFGNDSQFTFMQGLFNRDFHKGWFAGYDMPQLLGEVHMPILTPGG